MNTPADRRLTVAHVTHEAVVHMGGIGTVLQGLLTSPVYQEAVGRSVFLGPLWDRDDVRDVHSRLGGEGARVIYSGLDGYDPEGLAAKLRPIELAFGVRIVYGTRVFVDAQDPSRTAEAEVVLLDLHAADQRRENEFKAFLYEQHGIECHPFDHNDDFEQWVRLAQPGYAAIVALTDDRELPGVLISHEYMGMPAALCAAADPAGRFRTLFHGHECTTARGVVEHLPGHDAAFYPAMARAKAKGLSIEDAFGCQRNNYRHQLVSRAGALDAILAVGDDTAAELAFLSDEMSRAPIALCYNGVQCPPMSLDDKLAARRRVLGMLEPLVAFAPDHLLTHVTRPVISKGLWRDLRVLDHLDAKLAARGERAVYLLLTCGATPRSADDATRMHAEYGWPAHHRDGYPDLSGPETDLAHEAVRFNERARAVRAVVVNQFGFSPEALGAWAPEGLTIQDLRQAADAEFGLSVYEPFGIAPVEPLHAGAVCAVTAISGCAGFMRAAGGDESANVLIVDFGDHQHADPAAMTPGELAAIEDPRCAEIAEELDRRLPRTDAERDAMLRKGQALAGEMTWDRVCQREFIPALQALVGGEAAAV